MPDHQTGGRESHGSVLSSLLQLVVPSSQIEEQMAPILDLSTFPGDSNRVQTKGGSTHVCAHAADELGVTCHLANEQDTTGPGQSPAQDVFI